MWSSGLGRSTLFLRLYFWAFSLNMYPESKQLDFILFLYVLKCTCQQSKMSVGIWAEAFPLPYEEWSKINDLESPIIKLCTWWLWAWTFQVWLILIFILNWCLSLLIFSGSFHRWSVNKGSENHGLFENNLIFWWLVDYSLTN